MYLKVNSGTSLSPAAMVIIVIHPPKMAKGASILINLRLGSTTAQKQILNAKNGHISNKNARLVWMSL
jgi:hypothetical protein